MARWLITSLVLGAASLVSVACHQETAPSTRVAAKSQPLAGNKPWVAIRSHMMTGCIKRQGFRLAYAWAGAAECLQFNTSGQTVLSDHAFYLEPCGSSECAIYQAGALRTVYTIRGRTGGCAAVVDGQVVEETCNESDRSRWWMLGLGTIESVDAGELGLAANGTLSVGAGGGRHWLWVPTFAGAEVMLRNKGFTTQNCIETDTDAAGTALGRACNSSTSNQMLTFEPRWGNRMWIRASSGQCLTFDDSPPFKIVTAACLDQPSHQWIVQHTVEGLGEQYVMFQNAINPGFLYLNLTAGREIVASRTRGEVAQGKFDSRQWLIQWP